MTGLTEVFVCQQKNAYCKAGAVKKSHAVGKPVYDLIAITTGDLGDLVWLDEPGSPVMLWGLETVPETNGPDLEQDLPEPVMDEPVSDR
jgi:hypothetical protein